MSTGATQPEAALAGATAAIASREAVAAAANVRRDADPTLAATSVVLDISVPHSRPARARPARDAVTP
jgi:hypothetical protein